MDASVRVRAEAARVGEVAGGDDLLVGRLSIRRGQQVAGDLLAEELVVGLVALKVSMT